MNSKQSLLIIIGILFVGIAVVVGTNYFTSNSGQANRDAVIVDLKNLVILAEKYYMKTRTNDGKNTFVGWKIPQSVDTTSNGIYSCDVSDKSVILVGIGNEKGNNGIDPVMVTTTIDSARTVSTRINN